MERGPGGQMRVAGAFVQVYVKTFCGGREEGLLHPPVTLSSCVTVHVCQNKIKKKKKAGLFLEIRG